MLSPEGSALPPMPLLPISSAETIGKCRNFELSDSDIFICSYPKSGTTWCQHIVLSLLVAAASTGKRIIEPYSHVSEYAPFYEIDAHWRDDGAELIPKIQESHNHLGRRVFNTHFMLPSSPASCPAKFIYLLRSPLDTCTSFFHHLSNQVDGGCDDGFDAFFSERIAGEIPFGSWMDHVTSYVEAFRNGDDGRQFLVVTYEDMVNDLPSVVRKLAHFLELDGKIRDDQLEKELLPTFTFESMKANRERFQPISVNGRTTFPFYEKGRLGMRCRFSVSNN